MVRVAAAHSAKSLSLLLFRPIFDTDIEDGWGVDKASTVTSMTQLWGWLYERKERFGRNSRQGLHMAISVYQEDILVLEIGEGSAEKISEGLPRIMQENYGIDLSTKSEATKPFAKTVGSIGGNYYLNDMRHLRCLPSEDVNGRCIRMTDDIGRRIGHHIPKT